MVSPMHCKTNSHHQATIILIHDCTSFGRLGAHYRNRRLKTEQEFQIKKVIYHNSYGKPKGFAHDIALLKLTRPAKISQAVKLACLPGSKGRVRDGKMCWVTGN